MSRADDYQRLRTQALFLTDLVDLLLAGAAPKTRAMEAVAEAARVVRLAIGGAETVAGAYAGVIDRIKNANALVSRMKAEGRAPTHLEWEGLRAEIAAASDAISDDAKADERGS
jgi:hypothetical protein